MADFSQERIEVAEAEVHEGRLLRANVRASRRGTATELHLNLSLFERSTTPGVITTTFGPPGWHGGVCIERVPRRTKTVMQRAVMQSRVILDDAVMKMVASSPKLYGWVPGTGEARAAADKVIAALDADMVRRFPELFTAEVRVPGGAA